MNVVYLGKVSEETKDTPILVKPDFLGVPQDPPAG